MTFVGERLVGPYSTLRSLAALRMPGTARQRYRRNMPAAIARNQWPAAGILVAEEARDIIGV